MRSRGLLRGGWPVAVAVAAVVLGLVAGVLAEAQSSAWGFAAGVIGFFGVGGTLIAYYARRGRALAPLPMVTGLFVLEFAAGALFYHQPRRDSVLGDLVFAYTPSALETAVFLAFGAWVALVLGYACSGPAARLASRLPRPTVNDRATAVALVIWFVGWGARALMIRNGWYFHIADGTQTASGLRNIVVVLSNLPLVAAGLIGARYYRERPGSRWAYYALIAIEAVWAIPSGERSRLISLGLLLIVVRAYSSPRRFPVGPAIALALVSVLVVFPLGAAYRTMSGTPTGYQSDPVGQLSAAASVTLDSYARSPATALTEGARQTVQRFAGITSVAAIVHQGTEKYPATPESAVLMYGGALVPRALLPSKSDPSVLTTDFGLRYRIIAPGNTSSVAMTSVGDLWGTFGLAGLLVGMLLLGALVRTLASYFGSLSDNYALVAIYGVALGPLLLGFETSIAVGILQTLREITIYLVAVGFVGGAVRLISSPAASKVKSVPATPVA